MSRLDNDDQTTHVSVAELELELAQLGLTIVEPRNELERATAAWHMQHGVPGTQVSRLIADWHLN